VTRRGGLCRWSLGLLLVAASAAAACGPHANDARLKTADTDCAQCHMPEYLDAKDPVHVGVRPTACAVCHVQDAWSPSVFKHPKPAPKPQEQRTAVHDRPTTEEEHAHTIKHPHAKLQDHGPASPPSEPTSPLTEPAPQTAAPEHPDNRFPIASGAHAGIRCRTCHDQGGTMGKDNTDCVQCHARAKFDAIHDGVRGYPGGAAPLNFCLQCHASGRRRRS
jgi:hypothetical protein